MRLLFLLYGSLEQISGGYLYDRKVIEYLEAQGVQVDQLQIPTCPYLLCPLQSLLPAVRQVFRGSRSRDYDCIVVDELTHPSVFLSVSRRRHSVPPVVVLLHHLKIQERIGPLLRLFARSMERCLLRSCDAVIVNSETTRRTVGEMTRSQAGVYVCPPGCDTIIPEPGNAGGEGCREGRTAAAKVSHRLVRLLITGNIIPRKGHDILIRMLAGLSDLNWELRVVGGAADPRYKRRVDGLVQRHRLTDRVHYTGVLSGHELHREYREADLFVFPSRYEGFGISLAEAIRAGLPFVAFSSGAIPEVSGGRGLLVAEGDFDGFQSQLRRLIEDPSFREQTAAISRKVAGDLPTWAQTGRMFHEALEAII
jgi:glycosyltransferase involved in cell wall biosynthesis